MKSGIVEDRLSARASEIRANIRRAQDLLVGKAIISASPSFGPDVDARKVCECTGDWILEFADGTRVRVTASYDDSGVHFTEE